MNPIVEPSVQQALTLLYVLGGGLLLLTFLKTILEVFDFFRRKPPIDATIAALVREFNSQLQDKVSLRDFAACESRHAQHARDTEARFTALVKEQEARMRDEIRALDLRIDSRLTGLHASLGQVRSSLAETMYDVMKDLGFVQGAARRDGPKGAS